MDHILPTPNPDWDNPQRSDAPTPEEVDAFANIRAAADALRAWVTGAYMHGTTPDGWEQLGDRLGQLATMCTRLGRDKARTITAEPDHQP